MTEPSSALRAAAIDRAALALKAGKLQVIDRDWRSRERGLDLVATPGAGILAAIAVRAAARCAPGACVTAVSADRVVQLAAAGRACIGEHDALFDDLWLVVVAVGPDELARPGCAPAAGAQTGEIR